MSGSIDGHWLYADGKPHPERSMGRVCSIDYGRLAKEADESLAKRMAVVRKGGGNRGKALVIDLRGAPEETAKAVIRTSLCGYKSRKVSAVRHIDGLACSPARVSKSGKSVVLSVGTTGGSHLVKVVSYSRNGRHTVRPDILRRADEAGWHCWWGSPTNGDGHRTVVLTIPLTDVAQMERERIRAEEAAAAEKLASGQRASRLTADRILPDWQTAEDAEDVRVAVELGDWDLTQDTALAVAEARKAAKEAAEAEKLAKQKAAEKAAEVARLSELKIVADWKGVSLDAFRSWTPKQRRIAEHNARLAGKI